MLISDIQYTEKNTTEISISNEYTNDIMLFKTQNETLSTLL